MERSRHAKVIYAGLLVLALATWLAAVAITGSALGRPSPPRALAWTGSDPSSPEGRGLERLLVLEPDAAWAVSSRREPGGNETRLDVARLELARGVARRDWPLPERVRGDDGLDVQGMAHDPESGDLWLAIAPLRGEPWLHAVRVRAAGGVEDLGRAKAAEWEEVIATARHGGGLEVLTNECRALRFRAGAPAQVLDVAGCPPRGPRLNLTSGRWTGAGWRIAWWERGADGAVAHRVRGPGDAGSRPDVAIVAGGAAVDGVPFGALTYARGPSGQEPAPVPRPAGLPPAMHADYSRTVVRATPAGLRRAVHYGGFWHWCMAVPGVAGGLVCIDHEPHDHRSTWTTSAGARADGVVTPRWDPAEPLLLPAKAGGYWLLDHSHTAAGGRLYLRFDDALQRLDPLDVGERWDRLQPRTHAELAALMRTGGPHAASTPEDPDAIAHHLTMATLALPLAIFTLPLLLLAAALVQLARRRRPLLLSVPGAIAAALYLLVAIAQGAAFLKLTTWL